MEKDGAYLEVFEVGLIVYSCSQTAHCFDANDALSARLVWSWSGPAKSSVETTWG